MKRFLQSDKTPYRQPTLLYDGPTHEGYQKPSRAWERWFCTTTPWKDFKICSEFLTDFFDPSHHHFNVEVRQDPVKGKTLYVMEDVPKGHFILADSTTLNLDSFEWDILEDFISKYPGTTMVEELYKYVKAYGVDANIIGKTGWSVVLSPQTFVN